MFNQFITKYVDFTATELVDLNKKCTKVEFAKGDIIIKAGEVQENIYFITKGIIRNYVENSKGEIKIYKANLYRFCITYKNEHF
jgi:CRP-like cAMP-binding protein